jgi:hypothetical protein
MAITYTPFQASGTPVLPPNQTMSGAVPYVRERAVSIGIAS